MAVTYCFGNEPHMFTSHTVLFMRFVVLVISLALYSWDRVLLCGADCPRTQAGVCLSLHRELGFHMCTTTPGYSLHIFTVSMLEPVSEKGWLYFKTFKNQQGMNGLRDDKDTEPKLLGIWEILNLSTELLKICVLCVKLSRFYDFLLFLQVTKVCGDSRRKWYYGYECPL